MKTKQKFLSLLFLCGIYCLTIISCSSKENIPSENHAIEEEAPVNSETNSKTYKPSDIIIPRQDSYEYPYMGLKFSLPESLLEQIERKEIAMINFEEAVQDGTSLNYALISWKTMTKEQRDMEVESYENSFYDWTDSLSPIGAIGAYQTSAIEDLDTLTGCSNHNEIGTSSDGNYTYYLSINPDMDEDFQDEIKNISYEFTPIVSLQDYLSAFETANTAGSLGEFSMNDIEGNVFTQEMFADYELTMINVFTTWCTPCINEIPDLEKLKNNMADKGVNVVGIVLDSVDGSGSANNEVVEKAKLLAEKTGATYPFLIPDETYLNGRLAGITAVPETFFVDKNGNIIGETYSGSRSLDAWTEIVEKEREGAVQ